MSEREYKANNPCDCISARMGNSCTCNVRTRLKPLDMVTKEELLEQLRQAENQLTTVAAERDGWKRKHDELLHRKDGDVAWVNRPIRHIVEENERLRAQLEEAKR